MYQMLQRQEKITIISPKVPIHLTSPIFPFPSGIIRRKKKPRPKSTTRES